MKKRKRKRKKEKKRERKENERKKKRKRKCNQNFPDFFQKNRRINRSMIISHEKFGNICEFL